jgi:hypothetical protein
MPVVVIVLLFVAVAVIWIVLNSRSRRTPTFPLAGAGTVVAARTPGRNGLNVEQALLLLATRTQPRGAANLRTVVQVRITDHVPSDWKLDLAEGRCTVVAGTDTSTPLTIAAPSQIWVDLAESRTSFAGLAMKGTIQFEGDASILMRLDDEFSGPVDSSRLVSLSSEAMNPARSGPTATTDEANLTTTQPSVAAKGNPFLEALQEARSNPNLSPAERRAAMIEAFQHSTRQGLESNVTATGSIAGGLASMLAMSSGVHGGANVRAAIQAALRDLPPGATREQKIAAIRSAVQKVSIVTSSGEHPGSTSEGFREALAGSVIEGLLESFLGGD